MKFKLSLSARKWLKITAFILGGIIILATGGWFAFRNTILEKGWQKAVAKLSDKGYRLSCSSKKFSGLFTVSVEKMLLLSPKDTLLYSEKIEAGIDIWETAFSGPALSSLELLNTRVNLVNKGPDCNFCGLKSSENKETDEKDDRPLAQRMFDLLKRLLARAPADVKITDFTAKYTDSFDVNQLSIPELSYVRKDIYGKLLFAENGHSTGFQIKGNLNKRKITGKLELTPVSGKWAELPLLKSKMGIAAGFEKADFELEELDMKSGVLHLTADGHFQGITIDDRRIADTNVTIRNCSGKLVAHLGTDFAEIDSASSLSLNKIKTRLFARADMGKEKAYTLKFQAQRMSSNDFFQSLPAGMFSHLQGIETVGELEYRLYLHLEDKDPYGAVLESELKPYNFKITKMGQTDLRKMNGTFQHTFFERGRPVRTFTVGPANSAFTPLDQIPEMLRNAVMTGEDPAFFGHNGFYLEAFRQSIAQNYVRRRFSRGGSTISMQLVKNVFLSRKKTIARKAEEILIVWLIENQRLTSKARMFEVYLNIIEWGPGVFGVGEAAPFYFSKPAQQLEPLECAFLASIVPSPKSYRYFLDSAGNVSQRNWNFAAIRNRMIQKGMLDASDSASFNVRITGPAANYLLPKDAEPDEEEQKVLEDILNPDIRAIKRSE